MPFTQKSASACVLLAALAIAGCGSSSSSSTTRSATAGAPTTSSSSATTSSSPAASGTVSGPGALAADATSAATGDIPDNQVFLVYTNPSAGYSMKYPEGWTQAGSGRDITIRNKNNLVHIVVSSGAAPSTASVTAQLNALRRSNPSLTYSPPQTVQLGGHSMIKAVYTTQSAPNPVTGKRVKLIVDRYALASGTRTAVVDLGTPVGVDNVDAYRKMIESFQWK